MCLLFVSKPRLFGGEHQKAIKVISCFGGGRGGAINCDVRPPLSDMLLIWPKSSCLDEAQIRARQFLDLYRRRFMQTFLEDFVILGLCNIHQVHLLLRPPPLWNQDCRVYPGTTEKHTQLPSGFPKGGPPPRSAGRRCRTSDLGGLCSALPWSPRPCFFTHLTSSQVDCRRGHKGASRL